MGKAKTIAKKQDKPTVVSDGVGKKTKQRKSKVAGMHLPASRWRKPIKASLANGNHRIAANSDICVVGRIEYLVGKLLEQAAAHSAKQAKPRAHLTADDIYAALKDKDSGFYTVFPDHISGMN